MTKSTLFTLLSSLVLVFCLACKPDIEQTDSDADQTTVVTSPNQEFIPPYPALGNAFISKLYAEAEKVDIIFYDLPISVNQDDPGSAKSTVLYVAPTNPVVTAHCKPIARLSWIAEGKIIREADVYMDDGCEYMMFMENNEGFAVNAISPAGVEFFKNIIRSVDEQTK